jgi:hypothetical protein
MEPVRPPEPETIAGTAGYKFWKNGKAPDMKPWRRHS